MCACVGVWWKSWNFPRCQGTQTNRILKCIDFNMSKMFLFNLRRFLPGLGKGTWPAFALSSQVNLRYIHRLSTIFTFYFIPKCWNCQNIVDYYFWSRNVPLKRVQCTASVDNNVHLSSTKRFDHTKSIRLFVFFLNCPSWKILQSFVFFFPVSFYFFNKLLSWQTPKGSPGEGGANCRSVVGSVNFAGNKLTAC